MLQGQGAVPGKIWALPDFNMMTVKANTRSLWRQVVACQWLIPLLAQWTATGSLETSRNRRSSRRFHILSAPRKLEEKANAIVRVLMLDARAS
jgi:hypothetical protein